MKSQIALIQDDTILKSLVDNQNRIVELIAYGISYSGELVEVNLTDEFVKIVDGEQVAVLEFEQIQSCRLLN